MTNVVFYDIVQAELNDSFGIFIFFGVLSLFWFGGYGLYIGRSEKQEKFIPYLCAAFGFFMFVFVMATLSWGWVVRRSCIDDAT